jgi:hypothetical protein
MVVDGWLLMVLRLTLAQGELVSAQPQLELLTNSSRYCVRALFGHFVPVHLSRFIILTGL